MKQVVIFDFDGTIVDSNEIKNNVYLELFSSVSGQAKKNIEKISKESRKTRYQIIREILCFLQKTGELTVEDTEQDVQKYAREWGEMVEDRIINCKEVPGAFKALKFLSDNQYVLYILSGTPRKPLRKIVGIFIESGKIPPVKDVCGRDDDTEEKEFKKKVITGIMKKEKVLANQITLIGDGKNECEAALETGCTFVGIANDSNHWNQKERRFIVLENLTALPTLFKKQYLNNLFV